MKYKENMEQVAELKPDYMGFIFYAPSKRYVTTDFQIPSLPPEIKKVGVFVDADADYIIDKINTHNLDCIQLHGSEPPYFCRQMQRITCIIKAFGVDEHFDFHLLEPYKDTCDYFLFDTKTKEHGGSGQQFNWELLKNYPYTVPFFLSGGIDDQSSSQLKKFAANNPLLHAIDVNSKFEQEPGLKDIHKLKQFINEIRRQ